MTFAQLHFSEKIIDKQIGTIKKNDLKAFFSDGKFSMHDMLSYLLKITGPCKVMLSTFSISEAAIRCFHMEVKNKNITQLDCLFDYTTKTNKTQLLLFAENVCTTIKLAPNHSKLILMENADWKLVVVGSANMTPNPRKEAGVIITDNDTFDFYKSHLQIAMDEGLNVNLYERSK